MSALSFLASFSTRHQAATLRFLTCCLAGGPSSGAIDATSVHSPSPPDIIYILADDLGWADVGWQGQAIRTPHLDRLAQDGMRLGQFYTQPQCTPTRAALLTGRYPLHFGLHYGVILPYSEWGLPREVVTLPELLRARGYRTALVGKWHLGHHTAEQLPERRFDHFYGCYRGSLDYFTHRIPTGKPDLHRNGQPVEEEGYATFLFAREAARFIDTTPADRPFFLYLAFNAPHTPLQAPAEYVTRYRHLIPPTRATYAAMVTAMDDAVGMVVAALEKSGRRNRTLILFSSDNGGEDCSRVADNTPLRHEKGSTYEGGIRVPAFAHWPDRIKPGTCSTQLMHVVDVLPTLLEIAGVSPRPPAEIDGVSMVPAILAGRTVARPPIPFVSGPENFWNGLRDGEWKLVVARVPDRVRPDGAYQAPRLELYRILDDPSETRDLAAAEPGRTATMRRTLQTWFDRTKPSPFSFDQARPPKAKTAP